MQYVHNTIITRTCHTWRARASRRLRMHSLIPANIDQFGNTITRGGAEQPHALRAHGTGFNCANIRNVSRLRSKGTRNSIALDRKSIQRTRNWVRPKPAAPPPPPNRTIVCRLTAAGERAACGRPGKPLLQRCSASHGQIDACARVRAMHFYVFSRGIRMLVFIIVSYIHGTALSQRNTRAFVFRMRFRSLSSRVFACVRARVPNNFGAKEEDCSSSSTTATQHNTTQHANTVAGARAATQKLLGRSRTIRYVNDAMARRALNTHNIPTHNITYTYAPYASSCCNFQNLIGAHVECNRWCTTKSHRSISRCVCLLYDFYPFNDDDRRR